MALLGGCQALSPQPSRPTRMARIGLLSENDSAATAAVAARRQALLDGLRERGWVEGRNLTIERRSMDGNAEYLARAAAELVALPVDVLVASGTPVALAAQQATGTVPVVFIGVGYPVEVGLVTSLAQPGGNVTGVRNWSGPLTPKKLELLREAVPDLARVAVLLNQGNLSNRLAFGEAQVAAQPLGLQLRALDVRGAEDLDGAFAAARQWPADALYVSQAPVFQSLAAPVAELAARSRLPAMYSAREYVEAGGLMSYGVNPIAYFRRAAHYVDSVLRGAEPGDLPVEQGTTLEFVVNVAAARALGLTLPRSLLLLADETIE
jgi:putative ABC transport system substrate-binding protein